jgi:hypothetical protein
MNEARLWHIVPKGMASALLMSLAACSTLPHFDDSIYGKELIAPTVNDITNEVQCELLQTLKQGIRYSNETPEQQNNDKENSVYGQLPNFAWVANINLTLDVTDDEGVNPSLSYINGTNFVGALSGQWSEEQHRNLNLQFTLYLDGTTPTLHACSEPQKGNSGLRGNLGIAEIIKTGLPYAVGLPGPSPYNMKAIGVGLPGTSGTPVFGSTVDFSLVYGVGGTPTWTLTHFAGPGSSSGSLVTAMRTHKDTLVLSVSQSVDNTPSAISAAAKAAQDNTTRMILQRLLP